MIGQTNLKATMIQQMKDGTFPRFSIIVGEKGSGRKTLVNELYMEINRTQSMILYECNTKVESVRKAISEAYRIAGTPVIYLIADADDMSVSAKNALLKVTEEPPHDAYFIMTLQDLDSTLSTITSRASVYKMEVYKRDELKEYFLSKYKSKNMKFVLDICSTPGDIDLLEATCGEGKEDSFQHYIELVLDNMKQISLANALKSVDRIALKDTDEGKFDLLLFWRGVISVIMQRINKSLKIDVEQLQEWSDTVQYAHECIAVLRRTQSINKAALLDTWIMKMRGD